MKETRPVQYKKKKSSAQNRPDKNKEKYIQSLTEILLEHQIQVRRERLKRGSQWSVQSGICHVRDELTVFVDRGLSQDDQIEFLISTIRQLPINFDETTLKKLPKQIQHVLLSRVPESAAA